MRYRALLSASLRRLAADPQGVLTKDRQEILAGVRSFHIRHARADSREPAVGNPVHIVFYREREPGLIDIIRVLHQSMEPERHIEE